MTKRKVCTANGHTDWLRAQLAGKERADSEGSAGNDENEPLSTSSESPVSEKGIVRRLRLTTLRIGVFSVFFIVNSLGSYKS